MSVITKLPIPSKMLLLSLAIALQIAILAGEYLNSVYPLWVGKEVSLSIRPVDPRSMFRGNYARLDYVIGRPRVEALAPELKGKLRRGMVIYVSLSEKEGLWVATGLSLTRPDSGLYIRGRYTARWRSYIKYGIEAWFAPKEKALALERNVRRDRKATAQVRIAPNGKAALVGITLSDSKE